MPYNRGPLPNAYRTKLVFKSSRINLSYAAAAEPVTKSLFIAGNDIKDCIKSSTDLDQPPAIYSPTFATIYHRYFVHRAWLKYEIHIEDNAPQSRIYHWSTVIMPDGQGYMPNTTHNGLIRAIDPNLKGPTKCHTLTTGTVWRNMGRNYASTRYATRLTSPATLDTLKGTSTFTPGVTYVDPAAFEPGGWNWGSPDIYWMFQLGITRETFATASAAAILVTVDVQVVYDVTFMDRHPASNFKLTVPPLQAGYTEATETNAEAEYDIEDADWDETVPSIADRELKTETRLYP